jgi:hypothetical protein
MTNIRHYLSLLLPCVQVLPSLRKYLSISNVSARHQPSSTAATPQRRPPRSAQAEDSDEDEKEARWVQEELKRVKKERVVLLDSLAAARKDGSHSGGDLQAQDIAALRESLGQKQELLNELRERHAELEMRLDTLCLLRLLCVPAV